MGYENRPTAKAYTGDVYFDILKLRDAKINLAATLIHEVIHLKSCRKYLLKEKDEKTMSSRIYRVGYDLSTFEDIDRASLRGLNEAVTDLFTQEIWNENKEKFAEVLKISIGELQEDPESYYDPIAILQGVMRKIAETKKEDYGTVLNSIEVSPR